MSRYNSSILALLALISLVLPTLQTVAPYDPAVLTLDPIPSQNIKPVSKKARRLQESDMDIQVALPNSEVKELEINLCSVLEIPYAETGISLSVQNVINGNEMMISTTPFLDCFQIEMFECPYGADYCETFPLTAEDGSEFGSVDLKFNKQLCDHETIYLYFSPTEQDSIFLIAQFNSTNPLECGSTMPELDPNFESWTDPEPQAQPEPEPETQSEPEPQSESEAQSTPDQAGTNTTTSGSTTEEQSTNSWETCESLVSQEACQGAGSACSSKCMWLACKVIDSEAGAIKLIDSACVPTKTKSNDLQDMCMDNSDFENAAVENQIVEYPDCSSATAKDNATGSETVTSAEAKPESETVASAEAQPDSVKPHESALKVFGIVMLASFMMFMCIVCYYRRFFKANGYSPFTPPSCCPRFLFPRFREGESAFTPIGTDMSEYHPPVPIL